MALRKFVDALPIPSVLKPIDVQNGIPYYEVTMKQIKQQLHKDLPPTTVWGYNGMYPGPTFETRRNQPILVKWQNKLPFKHLLPVDRTLHGADPSQPSVRTVVHLHGGRVKPENDGFPEAWFTRDFENFGEKFEHKVYYYPNCQRPTTLWYHDHAVGITRLNVYAGLAGFFLIRDEAERKLKLPRGKFEIPLVIQDRSFYPNGELFYPTQPGHQPPPADQPPPAINDDPTFPNPSVVPEFFGDTALVNGKVWPFLEVEPRKYRFRILNGSNARFYNLKLSSSAPNLKFIIIGTDGGFLEKPSKSVSQILLAPAERVDVIVDFSNHKGQHIILTNDAPAPFPVGSPDAPAIPNIMQFRVKPKVSRPDRSQIPPKLSCFERLDKKDAIKIRTNTLVESMDEFDRLKLLLNNMEWSELPITETPYNGTIEIWDLFNLTPDTHPIHLHLVQFQLLSRAPFTGDPNNPLDPENPLVIGDPLPIDPSESGWKDTIRANRQEVTRIIARFGPFTGIYPWHCHILEHEDHEMMRPYEVLDNKQFNPCTPISGVCPDDSFTQCCDEKHRNCICEEDQQHDESSSHEPLKPHYRFKLCRRRY